MVEISEIVDISELVQISEIFEISVIIGVSWYKAEISETTEIFEKLRYMR